MPLSFPENTTTVYLMDPQLIDKKVFPRQDTNAFIMELLKKQGVSFLPLAALHEQQAIDIKNNGCTQFDQKFNGIMGAEYQEQYLVTGFAQAGQEALSQYLESSIKGPFEDHYEAKGGYNRCVSDLEVAIQKAHWKTQKQDVTLTQIGVAKQELVDQLAKAKEEVERDQLALTGLEAELKSSQVEGSKKNRVLDAASVVAKYGQENQAQMKSPESQDKIARYQTSLAGSRAKVEQLEKDIEAQKKAGAAFLAIRQAVFMQALVQKDAKAVTVVAEYFQDQTRTVYSSASSVVPPARSKSRASAHSTGSGGSQEDAEPAFFSGVVSDDNYQQVVTAAQAYQIAYQTHQRAQSILLKALNPWRDVLINEIAIDVGNDKEQQVQEHCQQYWFGQAQKDVDSFQRVFSLTERAAAIDKFKKLQDLDIALTKEVNELKGWAASKEQFTKILNAHPTPVGYEIPANVLRKHFPGSEQIGVISQDLGLIKTWQERDSRLKDASIDCFSSWQFCVLSHTLPAKGWLSLCYKQLVECPEDQLKKMITIVEPLLTSDGFMKGLLLDVNPLELKFILSKMMNSPVCSALKPCFNKMLSSPLLTAAVTQCQQPTEYPLGGKTPEEFFKAFLCVSPYGGVDQVFIEHNVTDNNFAVMAVRAAQEQIICTAQPQGDAKCLSTTYLPLSALMTYTVNNDNIAISLLAPDVVLTASTVAMVSQANQTPRMKKVTFANSNALNDSLAPLDAASLGSHDINSSAIMMGALSPETPQKSTARKRLAWGASESPLTASASDSPGFAAISPGLSSALEASPSAEQAVFETLAPFSPKKASAGRYIVMSGIQQMQPQASYTAISIPPDTSLKRRIDTIQEKMDAQRAKDTIVYATLAMAKQCLEEVQQVAGRAAGSQEVNNVIAQEVAYVLGQFPDLKIPKPTGELYIPGVGDMVLNFLKIAAPVAGIGLAASSVFAPTLTPVDKEINSVAQNEADQNIYKTSLVTGGVAVVLGIVFGIAALLNQSNLEASNKKIRKQLPTDFSGKWVDQVVATQWEESTLNSQLSLLRQMEAAASGNVPPILTEAIQAVERLKTVTASLRQDADSSPLGEEIVSLFNPKKCSDRVTASNAERAVEETASIRRKVNKASLGAVGAGFAAAAGLIGWQAYEGNQPPSSESFMTPVENKAAHASDAMLYALYALLAGLALYATLQVTNQGILRSKHDQVAKQANSPEAATPFAARVSDRRGMAQHLLDKNSNPTSDA